jgi:FkbM family methyltransferase
MLSRTTVPFFLKTLASRFPPRAQQELKRMRFRRQLRAGSFATAEPEYARLGEWITAGDCVVDIGANVGHYTVRLSQLVGATGRVLAFEPVPETFELLAANLAFLGVHNVSLFNVAVSAKTAEMGLSVPQFSSGLANFYCAGLTSTSPWPRNPDNEFNVLTIALDSLAFPLRVALVKLDVEGHELSALRGMQQLLRRDRPRLIVEGPTYETCTLLHDLGYDSLQLPHSPNRVFFATEPDAERDVRLPALQDTAH